MAGINKVFLLGNVGKIETFDGKNGIIAKLSIATSQKFKSKQNNEWQEVTEWHNVTIFGKLAEVAEKYVKKGSKLYIEGSLKTNKYQDKSGNDRYQLNIICKELQLLDKKEDDGNGNNRNGGGNRRRTSSDDYRRQSQSSDTLSEDDFQDDDLSDIPF